MMRWKCVCAFDGGGFSGWQSQVNENGVQDVIERGLGRILKRSVRVQGSSRTDAGVHALRFVFHFDADWPHSPQNLIAAFKTCLPTAIQVRSARRVSADFHAQHSAWGKRYVYHLYEGDPDPFERHLVWAHMKNLDCGAMNEAAALLEGKHDFSSFSAWSGREMESNVRDLRRLYVIRRRQRIRIIAEADGFLYKMVRSIAGVLVHVGLGKLRPEAVRAILEERKRTGLVPTAPPHALFLDRVFYKAPTGEEAMQTPESP